MATGYRVSVADGEGRPLQFVPVVPVLVTTGAEGTAVNTDQYGYASFTGLTDGTYRFRVRNVKQQTVTIEIVMFTHDHADADDGGGIAGAAITFATPAIVLGSAAAAGSTVTPIRSDSTIAAFDTTAPTTSALADAATVGTAAFAARRDHLHGRESFATPSIVLGTAAAAGAATTPIRSDSTIVAFDATAPTTSALGDAAATGSAAVASRRDHLHGRESFATNALILGTAAAAGAATTPMRSNDTIAAFDATVPTTQALADTAATGSVAFAARRDHLHGMFAASAIDHGSIGGIADDDHTIYALVSGGRAFTGAVTFNVSLLPDANDGAVLGAAGTAFSDLFLAEGAVINWDSGDVTLTQTGNQLAIAGGDFVPGTTDTVSLGTSSLNFSDLFLDLGGVINFDSGDVTLTHSNGNLAIASGDTAVATVAMTNSNATAGHVLDIDSTGVGSGTSVLDVQGGALLVRGDSRVAVKDAGGTQRLITTALADATGHVTANVRYFHV